MKLYKIYKEVILEDIERDKDLSDEIVNDVKLLETIISDLFISFKKINESVSQSQVIDAINGKYNVNILYRDYADLSIPPSKRYIQVYLLGKTKKKNGGNDAIRAYQIFGGSKHDEKNGWRVFRLDKIEGWFPTKVKFNQPINQKDSSIPTFKPTDKKMSPVYDKVEFNDFKVQPIPNNPNTNNNNNNAYQK